MGEKTIRQARRSRLAQGLVWAWAAWCAGFFVYLAFVNVVLLDSLSCPYPETDSVYADREWRLVPLGAECVFRFGADGRPVALSGPVARVVRQPIAPTETTIATIGFAGSLVALVLLSKRHGVDQQLAQILIVGGVLFMGFVLVLAL